MEKIINFKLYAKKSRFIHSFEKKVIFLLQIFSKTVIVEIKLINHKLALF